MFNELIMKNIYNLLSFITWKYYDSSTMIRQYFEKKTNKLLYPIDRLILV